MLWTSAMKGSLVQSYLGARRATLIFITYNLELYALMALASSSIKRGYCTRLSLKISFSSTILWHSNEQKHQSHVTSTLIEEACFSH